MKKQFSAREIDRKFDDGENVLDYFDLENPIVESAPARNDTVRQLSLSLPEWLIARLDEEAKRCGVTRQSLVKIWLVERSDEETRKQILLQSA